MTIEAGLARAAARAAARIARGVPADVAVTADGDRIRIAGRRLAVRALTDPRLRDFAGLVR